MIGVPIKAKNTVGDGLDALLSVVQMPPGVPVACVAINGARNAAVLAARILGLLTSARDRTLHPPGDGARSGPSSASSRPGCEVELAVCEALAEPGVIPTDDLEQIKSRRLFRPRGGAASASASPTTTWPRSSTSSLQSVGEAGRWIHYGLTSSDVLDTALALQLREAGRELLAGADALTAALVARAREFGDTLCVGPHARRARRADHLRAEAGRLRLREPSATPTGSGAPSRQLEVGKLSGAVGTYSALAPRSSARRWQRLGLRPEPTSRRRWFRVTATPRC